MEPLNSFQGSYDIPIEDLKRYRKLSPEEILRWLEEINSLMRQIQAKEFPKQDIRPDSGDLK